MVISSNVGSCEEEFQWGCCFLLGFETGEPWAAEGSGSGLNLGLGLGLGLEIFFRIKLLLMVS